MATPATPNGLGALRPDHTLASTAATRCAARDLISAAPPGDFSVPLLEVVANCITVRGSFVGNREDMAEALAFAVDAKVKADIELQPLSAINDVFDRLEHGRVAGRVRIRRHGQHGDDAESGIRRLGAAR